MSAEADTADGRQNTAERVAELERRLNHLAQLEPAVAKLARAAAENGDGSVIEAAAETAARMSELRERVGQLENRLVDIEDALDTTGLEYQEMNKAQRVARIRDHLVGKAEDRQNGKASMTPDEIGALFDGHPSVGYTYKLADTAAEADGFDVGKPRDGNKRLTVELEAVNGGADDSRREQ